MLNTQMVNLRISAGRNDQFPHDPIPQICFSGRSNVGKSSLINTLLNQKKLARVSSAPGKTITINFFEIDKKLFFVDLPGYGFAKRSSSDAAVWRRLTHGYFTNNPDIDRLSLVIQLIDSRIGPTEDDETMLSYMQSANLPYVIVLTKVDKLSKSARIISTERMMAHPLAKGVPIIPFSSLTGEGKAELWKEIYRMAGL